MSNNFRKMTAWLATASLVLGFVMMPTGAAAATVYKYEWKSQSGTISADGLAHEYQGVTAGQTINLSLTMINRSGTTIKGKSALPAGTLQVPVGVWGIGTQNPQDGTPSFLDLSSFVLNNNRFVYYDGADVPDGSEITFDWPVTMATTLAAGTYKLYVRPVSEFLAWTRQVKNGITLPGTNSDIFWQFVVGSGTSTPATGGLSIALAGDTPAPASIADNSNANFTKFTMTAAAGSTVNVTEIFVTRTGLSSDADAENVKLLGSDGVQIGGTAGGFNANHKAQIFINPALAITGTMTFYLRAGIVDDTVAGKTVILGIAANDDIKSNATSVNGASVYGYAMTTVLITVGTITLAEEGSISDSTPDVGDLRVLTNTFKLTAGSTEEIIIERITVLKQGTAATEDTANIELYDTTHAVSIGTVASWTGDGKASYALNMKLGKGETVKFAVYLDIKDGASLTVTTDLSDGSDALVVAKGVSYGFYVTPTYDSSAWNGKGDAVQTINAGALVVGKSASTPATGKIAVADAQLLAVWDFTVTGEEMRISSLTVRGNLAEDSGSALTYADLTNTTLVDMGTGNILAGPVDGTDGAGTYGTTAIDPKFTFSSTFTLPVGVNKVGIKTKLGSDWANDDTIIVTLYQAADLTVKGVMTNNTVTPTGFAAAGNTQTVNGGALVVRTLGTPPTGSVITGTTGFTWGTFSFDADDSGEDVRITAVTVTDTVDATTGALANIDQAKIYADLDSNGTFETLLDGPDFPAGAAGTTATHAFTFNQEVIVPKGTVINWSLVGDLATGAVAGGTHAFTVAADGATASGFDTGATITDTASGSAGTLTVAAGGSVTSALAASSPNTGLVVAGNTYAALGAFDVIASDEAYVVDKLTFDMTAGYDSMQTVKITYPTKTGTDSRETSVSAAAIAFSGLTMYVPKNGRSTVTVTGTTKTVGGVGTGGTFRDLLILVLDTSAAGEFNATGESSQAAKTGSDIGDQTAATMYLYNTVPTIVAANPGTTGTIQQGGVAELYKFKVTADAAGAVAIKKFTFQIFITDASTTTASTADLGGFTFLRNGTPITSSAQITQISTDGGATYLATPLSIETDDTNDLENNTSYWVQVAFGQTPAGDTEQLVGAGETVTYTLSATAGTGFVTTDAWSTQLLYDSTIADATATYLADADTGTGVQQVVALQTSAGISEWSDVEFIWSDRSTVVHVASFDDDGVVETSSADWTNGYLISSFPIASYGFTL
ncbi:hypothetical protein KKE14_00835 [Patescibacteria group bacterium]|nr:hypothetical protein [Patescibacteria group bacterium]